MEHSFLFHCYLENEKRCFVTGVLSKKAGNIPFPSSQKKKNSQLGKKRKTNDLNIKKKNIFITITPKRSHIITEIFSDDFGEITTVMSE